MKNIPLFNWPINNPVFILDKKGMLLVIIFLIANFIIITLNESPAQEKGSRWSESPWLVQAPHSETDIIG